uniref:tRNA (guanine(37)-N1)-methyltransferase n=1 Tax=Lutzomyia longipalpis TaxID=7200 RepID=A0A7G3AW99_LUTLO
MLEKSSWRKTLRIIWISIRTKRYARMTDCGDFVPAKARGMTILDRSVFQQTVCVPQLTIEAAHLAKVLPILRKKLLKLEHLRPVSGQDPKTILLHPGHVKSWEDVKALEEVKILPEALNFREIVVSYENFKSDDIFRAVLPDGQENLSSFSRIGHIVHVNLKEHLLPYRRLIGEVFLDKIPNCRAVVNKIQTIDSKFRNFQMELLAGEEDYKVEVRENGCVFEFDFAKVYWNPRLASEHERIVKSLKPGDHFCDVFAGVGPFSVPAARKCHVLANDLNPDSFQWLQHNAKRNKVEKSLKAFNRDGREFIRKELKEHLMEFWKLNDPEKTFVIAMNLPAMAVEFLDTFPGLFADHPEVQTPGRSLPVVHVYTFVKGGPAEDARKAAEANLGQEITNFDGVSFVRNVAPNKDMFREAQKMGRKNRHTLIQNAKADKAKAGEGSAKTSPQ